MFAGKRERDPRGRPTIRAGRWGDVADVPSDVLARQPRYVSAERARGLPQLEPARLPEASRPRRRLR